MKQLVQSEFRILNRFVSFFIYTFLVILVGFGVVVFTLEKTDTIAVQGVAVSDDPAYVRSPVQGTVTELYVKEGDEIRAGDTICAIGSIESDESWRLRCLVPERQAAAIRPGQKANVAFTALPYFIGKLYEGTVVFVSSIPTPVQADQRDHRKGDVFYSVEIRMNASSLDDAFRGTVERGMSATARIETGRRPLIKFLWEKVMRKGGRVP